MLLLYLDLKFPSTFRFKISISTSLETFFKENYIFRDLLRIALMLGWFLYFITRLSSGSSELTLVNDKSSYFGIYNLATILEKKLLKISDIDFLSNRTLTRERRFNRFPKQFVIGDIPIIKIVVIISLRFKY